MRPLIDKLAANKLVVHKTLANKFFVHKTLVNKLFIRKTLVSGILTNEIGAGILRGAGTCMGPCPSIFQKCAI